MEREGWVPVTEEKNHRELFRNDLIRVYMAVLPPGSHTEYHRHDQDTLYIVIAGGSSSTDTVEGRAPYRFGRSVVLWRKMAMLFSRALCGYVRLPTGSAMFMANRSLPIIHAVKAAPGNTSPMLLMGIEFLSRGPTSAGRPRESSDNISNMVDVRTVELAIEQAFVMRYSGIEELREMLNMSARGILAVAVSGMAAGNIFYAGEGGGTGAIAQVATSGFVVALT